MRMLRRFSFFAILIVAPANLAVGQRAPTPAYVDENAESLPVPEMGEQIEQYIGPEEVFWDEEPYLGPVVPQGYGGPFYRHGHLAVDVEALIWWSHGMRLPPLVTTSLAGTPIDAAGVLGDSFSETLTTTVLFGAEREPMSTNTGGRLTVAYWTDAKETLGIVGSFLAVDGGDFSSTFASAGDPIIARPFFNIESGVGQQDASVIAHGGTRQGFVTVNGSNEIVGSEVYLQENLFWGRCQRLEFLYGYRYFRVDEELGIRDRVEFPSGEGLILAGTSIDSFERFDTQNSFHGGQIGFKWQRQYPVWTMEGLFKLALGQMQQQTVIEGMTTVTVPTPFSQSSASGGLLALPTNIGTHEQNRFAVIPEFSIGGFVCLSPHWKVSLAYDLVYISHVLRPGDQIDLTINPTQLNNGTLAGGERPRFAFDETDYWVQGLSIGLEYRR